MERGAGKGQKTKCRNGIASCNLQYAANASCQIYCDGWMQLLAGVFGAPFAGVGVAVAAGRLWWLPFFALFAFDRERRVGEKNGDDAICNGDGSNGWVWRRTDCKMGMGRG